jgi:propanediol dehydratase small subunit
MKLTNEQAFQLRQAMTNYGLWTRYEDKVVMADTKAERDALKMQAQDFRDAMNRRLSEAFDTNFSELCFASAEYERAKK